MTWTRSSTQLLEVERELVWPVLADLPGWSRWDPDLVEVIPSGDGGDFVPSGRFRGPAHAKIAEPFTIAERVEGERIVVRQPVPFGAMRLEFRLADAAGGRTEFTQHVTLTGPLARVMVWIIGGDVVHHFPEKCAALERLASPATA
ncbi:SRPBCC family protein [Amycolatopsis sp. YIM 10]|uniref:SRPBCC family protein n=1 Tax=Amycolatopsis sp. YIM 10 TaxID=2653857 RepID=UPI0012902E6B|nr:SRPBCC family protein [Amycolatopsis sp. YIM 10]QFU86263.1 Polyketide cyclase / dehydrase and lipid transport [Amycolatopsis sp. YIM 10]